MLTSTTHLRIARPSDDLAALRRFYGEGLGLELLCEFRDHAGFHGVMLGRRGASVHLEFTSKPGHLAGRAPTQDNLLVFHLPARAAYECAVARLKRFGYAPAPSFNPYWDEHGTTFEDPDGYRVVLANAVWPPESDAASAPRGDVSIGRHGAASALEGSELAAYPDARSFRMKFGLVVPATNTSMEHELWSVVFRNASALQGVGLHTSSVITPDPRVGDATTLAAYREQFLGGLRAALDTAALAEPQRLILGMSLEHILCGIDAIERTMRDVEAHARVACSTSHAAFAAALRSVGARRLGLLTPFDDTGTANARRMFEDLGFEVVASVGLACANAVQIAHVPDWAKERAIQDGLASPGNRLDAIVQCGTNMSLLDVSERLEPVLGIPILGVNAVLLWHALRESGLAAPLLGAGRLLREH